MTEFFSYLLKRLSANKQGKKIAFSVLLFFVLAGVFVPKIALAAITDWDAECFLNAVAAITCAANDGHLPIAGGVIKDTTVKVVGPVISGWTDGIMIGLITWTAEILSQGSYYFALYSSKLFTYLLSTIVKDPKWAITRVCTINVDPCPLSGQTIGGSVFLASWNIVKEWANILIALGLIAISISTILRLKEYEAKKLLPGIIMVALLVNFSVVFVGLMIDASNITIQSLIGAINGSGHSRIIQKINDAWNNTVRNMTTNTVAETLNYFGLDLIFDIMYVVVGITLLFFTFIFIQRYIALAILFILSPLAFVFYAFPFPKAKELWNKWWQNFIKWCFIGLGGAFFLVLSTSIIGAFPVSSWTVTGSQDLARIFLQIFIILGFLFTGLRLTIKSSGPITTMIMGAAAAIVAAIVTGGVSLAGTAAGGVLKATGAAGLGNQLSERARQVGRNIKDRATGFGEKIGAVKLGTTSMNQKARFEKELNEKDRVNRVEAMSAQQRATIIRKQRWGLNGSLDRAKTFEQMAKDGQIDALTPQERERETKNAMYYGTDMKDIYKADPRLRRFDKVKIEEEKRKLIGTQSGVIDPKTGVNINYTSNDLRNSKSILGRRMQETAEKSVVASEFRKLNINDITEKLSKDAMGIEFAENTTSQRIERARDLSADKKVELKKLLGRGGALDRAGRAAIAAGNTAKVDELRKIYAAIRNL